MMMQLFNIARFKQIFYDMFDFNITTELTSGNSIKIDNVNFTNFRRDPKPQSPWN